MNQWKQDANTRNRPQVQENERDQVKFEFCITLIVREDGATILNQL